jgi:S-DNA-T family DNA segregation ATPase FtsK/SpoIIIE
MCSSKCCPGDEAHGLGAVVLAVVAVAAAVVLHRVIAIAVHVVADVLHVGVLVFWALLAAVVVLGIVRLALAVPLVDVRDRAAWRNYPRAILARLRWRWLARNLALAHTDAHHHRGGKSGQPVRVKVRYPAARFRADRHGVTAKIRTVPKAGREEFEKSAQHLADEWRCQRVHVAQRKPGRLVVRGLVTDPLSVRFGPEGAPAGTYTDPSPFRPYLGRDEWNTDRYADLSGITGISVAGLPGYGKTSLILSLLWQLAGTGAVQFNFIDGKGGGDYMDWRDRAWQHCGDELEHAAGILEDTHGLMRRRLLEVAAGGGSKNWWHQGPTPEHPLIVTVIDECHTFFDLDAVKGDKEAEGHVRMARTMTSQLVRKGRSVLFLTILITQKQTSDAIPTAIRDNCTLGFSFAVKTKDAAVAGLGEGIRDYPSYSPTGLRERPTYIGVTTATLPSGADPFVRLRVPEITEEAAAGRALETAGLRFDPSQISVPSAGPALIPEGAR